MDYVLAAIGSITSAVKLKKTIAKTGITTPIVIHTPSVINKGGCSYSIKFKHEYIPLVKDCAKSAKINIKGIYIEINNGGESEYHAIS